MLLAVLTLSHHFQNQVDYLLLSIPYVSWSAYIGRLSWLCWREIQESSRPLTKTRYFFPILVLCVDHPPPAT
ncbi:hypothetical protein SLEP1_g39664 [Rubroshorea leprosula]|uniref:Uncharacterized protein n=1 Tax=Rubroshorea leprosula TaxID=152421 RepID=A0AAV5L1P9_9ROSI|nr:hypothetical protein SLEP1_g39664 [Rubroshorea leprosula]